MRLPSRLRGRGVRPTERSVLEFRLLQRRRVRRPAGQSADVSVRTRLPRTELLRIGWYVYERALRM